MASNPQTAIVQQLLRYWSDTTTARKDVDMMHARVIESYNAKLPQKVRESKAIQTRTHLGWTTRAVDTFTARTSPLLMPSASGFFSLYDVSQRLALSCSVMSALLAYFFTESNLEEDFSRILDMMALEGSVGLYPRWLYPDGPGALPELQIDVMNSQDVCVYPVTEHLSRAVVMMRTWLTKNELLAMAQADPLHAFDLDAIANIKQKETYTHPLAPNRRGDYIARTYDTRLGVEVIEFFAPELRVEDTVYTNVLATVANQKDLIRFLSSEPNAQRPSLRRPIFACLKEHYEQGIGRVRIGVGLCNAALDLEMAAITIHNLAVDNIKDTVKPPRVYDPTDPYWNHDRSGFAPGELVASLSTNPRHLLPLDTSQRAVPQSEEQISRLMYQFESAVGIPNFLSGTSDTDDRRVSATAKRLEAAGADTRIRKYAVDINNRVLRPLTVDAYNMIREKLMGELAGVQQEQADLARGMHTNQPTQRPFLALASALCPDFDDWLQSGQGVPPIEAIALKLSTFEDAVRRVDQVNSAERAINALGPLATAAPDFGAAILAMVDAPSFVRMYFTDLDLEGALKTPKQVQEGLQQQQQQQQQQEQMAQQAQLAQMQMALQTGSAEIDKTKAETQRTIMESAKIANEIENPPEKDTKNDAKPKPKGSGE
ncbi:MAG: hypothetical protein IPK63_15740 [Candidatus Competibacteraceae bacterium]|nr:hypothetical protein [Candidatus Competibacteraceae bacterium]MBK8184248.1 hypothetical protein [Candidatus Competibacteraceae bacterium]